MIRTFKIIISRVRDIVIQQIPKKTSETTYIIKQSTKNKCKKISDYRYLFSDFKNTTQYADITKYLFYNDVNSVPTTAEIKSLLYEHFLDFRLYLHSVVPNIIDTDIDYCIFTLSGIKQKHMYKLLHISQSGIRNIKPRLKEKLPEEIYNYIFQSDYTAI